MHWLTCTVRIGVYGDEANISDNVYHPFKIFCLFLNILHYRPKSARLSRFLLCAVRSEWLIHPLTLRPILSRIVWSLNIAYEGVDPTQPSKPLCVNGARFIVGEFRGDQEFHRMIWQHAASWKSKYVCYQCRATSIGNTHTYTDLSDTPLWECTEHTNVSFINVELPAYPCP